MARGCNSERDNTLSLASDVVIDSRTNEAQSHLEGRRQTWRNTVGPDLNCDGPFIGRPPDCVLKEGQISTRDPYSSKLGKMERRVLGWWSKLWILTGG